MWDEIEKKAGSVLIRFVWFLFVFYFALPKRLQVSIPDSFNKQVQFLNHVLVVFFCLNYTLYVVYFLWVCLWVYLFEVHLNCVMDSTNHYNTSCTIPKTCGKL